MHKNLILALIFLSNVASLLAQNLQIIVLDTERKALSGANVSLQLPNNRTEDRISDENGLALFPKPNSPTFRIYISYIGYGTVDTLLSTQQELNSFTFQLEENTAILNEVTVQARKPLLRQEGDKTIVDPTPLLDISTHSLELLEMTPGLFVDQDGAVYLSNTTPAAIYINGREQRFSSQDIANLLRSLPPSSILRIELMRNPSAKYDAASSGGIINIVLKKGTKIGRFGSVNLSLNQGKAGNRSAGFQLNESGDRLSWYVNLNANRDAGWQTVSSNRQTQAPFTLAQQSGTQRVNDNGFVGAGTTFDLHPSHQISYDGRFSPNLNNSVLNSQNIILGTENNPVGNTENKVKNVGYNLNHQHDLSYRWKIDTLGSQLDVKWGLGQTAQINNQEYIHLFSQPSLPSDEGEGELNNRRQFMQFQADALYYLPWKMQLEAGLKGSNLYFDSQADFVRLEPGGNTIPDLLRTIRYEYKERIYAAYVQGTQTLPWGIQLKAGMRMEQTDMKGKQTVPTDTSFRVQRLDWFPYLYLSRKVMSVAGFDVKAFVIYRKTLSRPGYQSLNPAIRIVDQFNYETGNPGLSPQFTDNYELNISVQDYPLFAIGQNLTQGIISNVIYNDEVDPALTRQTYDNIGQSRESYFRITGGIPPSGRFFGVLGAQYNLTEYEGLYENRPIGFRRGSWRIFTFQSLKITKTTKLMLSGFMLIDGQMNLTELENFGQLNLTLNQSFSDNKLQLSVFGRDVFRTMETRFSLIQGDIRVFGDRYADNQRIGATLRYQFGIRKREEKKRNNFFPEEEG